MDSKASEQVSQGESVAPHLGLSDVPYQTALSNNLYLDNQTGEIIEREFALEVFAGMAKMHFEGDMINFLDNHPHAPSREDDSKDENILEDQEEKTSKRGKVEGMSRRSRKRMIEAVSKIRNVEKSFFVTLTYPDLFPEDMQTVKRDLKVFIQRLMRKYPTCGYIWRMEYKDRLSGENKGKVAPHFHLIVLLQESVFDFRQWVKENWHEVIGTNDPKHLKAGTQVDRVRSRRGAMKYTSKYLSKVDEVEVPDNGGRTWGEGGQLDRTPYTTIRLTYRQWIDLRRLMAQRRPDKKNIRRRGYDVRKIKPVFTTSLLGIGLEDSNTFLQQALRAIGYQF